MENTSSVRSNANQTLTSITQIRRRRALDAEIAAQRREIDRLSDLVEFPEYVQLCGTLTEGMGLTADQRIDFSGDMYEFAESRGMPLSLAMCEAFFEHIEARALAAASERGLACVVESCAPAIVLAFRTRNARS
jgi:hypothetical protein